MRLKHLRAGVLCGFLFLGGAAQAAGGVGSQIPQIDKEFCQSSGMNRVVQDLVLQGAIIYAQSTEYGPVLDVLGIKTASDAREFLCDDLRLDNLDGIIAGSVENAAGESSDVAEFLEFEGLDSPEDIQDALSDPDLRKMLVEIAYQYLSNSEYGSILKMLGINSAEDLLKLLESLQQQQI